MNNTSEVIKDDLGLDLILSKRYKLDEARVYFLIEQERELIKNRTSKQERFLFENMPIEEKHMLCFNYKKLTLSELAIAYSLISKIVNKYNNLYNFYFNQYSSLIVSYKADKILNEMNYLLEYLSIYKDLQDKILEEYASRIYVSLNEKNRGKVLKLCHKEAKRYDNLANDLKKI